MSGWSLHFSFEVDPAHSIIYEKIHGLWQAKTARDYHEEFITQVEPLIKKPWAKLVDLSNWRTSYPDVSRLIGEHLAWCIEHNMQLSLNVLNNPSTFRQLNEMFKIGASAGMSHTFRTMDDAKAYLDKNWFSRQKKK